MLKRNGNKYLYFIAILAFTLGGTLNRTFFTFSFLSPSECTIVILFMVLLTKGLALNRSYVFNITWVDKIYFFYFLCAIIIPIFANSADLNIDIDFFKFMLPIKIWVVYRIFYCLLFENYLEGKLNEAIDLIMNLVLFISAIASLIGILRFLNLPAITDLINHIWIAEAIPRLWSTMGGINTGALFFAICAIISIFQSIKHNKNIYLIYFSLFIFSVILTGSFSATITLIFALIIFFKKYFNAKRLLITISFLTICFIVIQISEPLKKAIDDIVQLRIKHQFHRGPLYGIIPSHLVGRYLRWVRLYDYFLEKPIFGYGFKGVPEIPGTGVYSHNYYVYLVIYSGMLGLLAYLFMNYMILKKLNKLKQFKHEGFLIILIISMYLISQISQLSFQYGGLSEFFGILLALTAIMVKSEIRTDRNDSEQKVL